MSGAVIALPAIETNKRARIEDSPKEVKKPKETTTQECKQFPFKYLYIVSQNAAEHDVVRFRLVPDIVSGAELATKWMKEHTVKAENGKKESFGWKRKRKESVISFYSGECISQHFGEYYDIMDAINLDENLNFDKMYVSVFRLDVESEIECI